MRAILWIVVKQTKLLSINYGCFGCWLLLWEKVFMPCWVWLCHSSSSLSLRSLNFLATKTGFVVKNVCEVKSALNFQSGNFRQFFPKIRHDCLHHRVDDFGKVKDLQLRRFLMFVFELPLMVVTAV